MSKWKEIDDEKLLSLAHQNLSVEEMRESFPDFPSGSIAIRLNLLKKRHQLPKDFKIRMKNWDEKNLIDYVRQNLSAFEIAKKYPELSVQTIIGRLYWLRREGKLPKDYKILTDLKPTQQIQNIDDLFENAEQTEVIQQIQIKEMPDESTTHENIKKIQPESEIPIQIKPFDKKDLRPTLQFIGRIIRNQNENIKINETCKSSHPTPRYTIIECPINSEEQKISFLDLLAKNIELYDGPNKEIQKYCPKFFKLLSNILNDKFVDWHTKVMISAALGYFVLEEDVIPDTESNGYIDDLYLVTYILNEIKNNQSPEIIIRNWSGEEDIIRLIDEIFIVASDIVGPLSKHILQKVGLYKFSLLSLEEYSGEYSKKEARLANEKRDLLALLAYIIQKVEKDDLKSRSYSKIKKYVENNGNYDEIQRIIEISKLYHQIETESIDKPDDFVKMLEQRMREARFCALKEKNK